MIESVTGSAIDSWLGAAAELRIRVFREYPYLYDGDLAYERNYLGHLARAQGSVLVLARTPSEVVGCATALPLVEADRDFRRPFERSEFENETICYFGESVLDKRWRGHGIGHRFFDQREAHARRLGATLTTFCAVKRAADHPLKPVRYRSLDTFWHKRGYQRRDDLVTHFAWKDIDQPAETEKPMVFWIRPFPAS